MCGRSWQSYIYLQDYHSIIDKTRSYDQIDGLGLSLENFLLQPKLKIDSGSMKKPYVFNIKINLVKTKEAVYD